MPSKVTISKQTDCEHVVAPVVTIRAEAHVLIIKTTWQTLNILKANFDINVRVLTVLSLFIFDQYLLLSCTGANLIN